MGKIHFTQSDQMVINVSLFKKKERMMLSFGSLLQDNLQEGVSEYPRTPTLSNTRMEPTELMRC